MRKHNILILTINALSALTPDQPHAPYLVAAQPGPLPLELPQSLLSVFDAPRFVLAPAHCHVSVAC